MNCAHKVWQSREPNGSIKSRVYGIYNNNPRPGAVTFKQLLISSCVCCARVCFESAWASLDGLFILGMTHGNSDREEGLVELE